MTSSITARSSPLALGIEMRRLASATIASLFTRSAGDALVIDLDPLIRPREPHSADGSGAWILASGWLKSFEPSDVDDEHDRAADFDLEVFRHVKQSRLQGGGVRNRYLGPAAACAPQDPQHRLYLLILDTDQ